MNGGTAIRLAAWAVALGLLALPVVGVLNGWFASERWPIGQLAVSAEFNHVSAAQIRAAALPLLGQGFFAVRLDAVRDAVARLPWVQRVEARKRWPDTIELVVYEQQPYARWGEDRLVNRQGALFRAAGAAAVQGLPRLSGPDDRLAEVLAFYADCLREFAGSGLVIGALALSPRGGWRLELASGAVIEVGREDPHPRLKRFLDIWPRLAASHPEAPAYADLRYENGFAVRWSAPPPSGGNGESGMGNGQSRSPEGAAVAPERRPLAARSGERHVPRADAAGGFPRFALAGISPRSPMVIPLPLSHSLSPIPDSRLQ